MAEVTLSTKLPVSASKVWKTIGAFNAVPDWHPAVERCEMSGDGKIRTLHLAGGGKIVESLESHDNGSRQYTYRITESPLPVEDYVSTISIRDDGDEGCTVEWSSNFSAAAPSLSAAQKAIAGIYEAGLDNLRRMFGG